MGPEAGTEEDTGGPPHKMRSCLGHDTDQKRLERKYSPISHTCVSKTLEDASVEKKKKAESFGPPVGVWGPGSSKMSAKALHRLL